MASDLVVNLRQLAAALPDAAGNMVRLGADEIERLTHENAEKEAAFVSCSHDRARIAQARSRLRAALEQIAEAGPMPAGGSTETCRIAREALRGAEETTEE
jgi:hypothetical protein